MADKANGVQRLRELLAKATPGPWQSKAPYLWDEIIGNVDGPDDGQYHYTEVAQVFGRADAELVVEAINALPAILADYEQLQAKLEAAEALASQIRTDWLPANERLAARAEAAEQRVRELQSEVAANRVDAQAVYAQIPDLPVTPETAEQATNALTEFCMRFNDALTGSGSADNGND